jgi:hypothetical protein
MRGGPLKPTPHFFQVQKIRAPVGFYTGAIDLLKIEPKTKKSCNKIDEPYCLRHGSSTGFVEAQSHVRCPLKIFKKYSRIFKYLAYLVYVMNSRMRGEIKAFMADICNLSTSFDQDSSLGNVWDIGMVMVSNTPIEALRGHVKVKGTSILFPKTYLDRDFNLYGIAEGGSGLLYYCSLGKILLTEKDTVRIDLSNLGAYSFANASWGTLANNISTISTLTPR